MLHIIKTESGLVDALNYMDQEDQILLIEEAVFAIFRPNSVLTQQKDLNDHTWVLEADLIARGLTLSPDSKIQSIDFTGFIYLTEQAKSSMTWE
ncbi:MAG: sulfurtransferase complex subunit TusB [Vibrio sp.]